MDPLADAAPAWTPYRYGFNNPVLFIDPNGLFEVDPWYRNNETGEFQFFEEDQSSLSIGGNTWTNYGDGFSTMSSSGLTTNYRADGSFDHYSTSGNTLPEVVVTSESKASSPSLLDRAVPAIASAGVASGTFENMIYSSNAFTGEEIWHGKTTNRFYSSTNYHPNNYVMNRSKLLAKADAAPFRLAAQGTFFISAGVNASTLISGNSNTAQKAWAGGDLILGAVGTYGGPYGMAAYGTYELHKFQLKLIQQGYLETNPRPTFNYVGGLQPTFHIPSGK